MNEKTSVFKIGGKILEDIENLNSTISQLTQLYNEGLFNKIILIPGGGSFANFIRKIYSELKFTEEVAHWMGIISMNYNGLELNKKFPNLKIIEDFTILREKSNFFCIFLPYEFIKENDILPHSWDVTSDSISLFIAEKLQLPECFLIKDVDGIFNEKGQIIRELSTSEFINMKDSGKLAKIASDTEEIKKSSTPIDPYIINLINSYHINCIILNGSKNTNRVLDYFKTEKLDKKVYTRIK